MSVPGYRPCRSGPGARLTDRLLSLILDLPHHCGLVWWSLDCVTASASLVTTLGSWLTLLCGTAGPCFSLTLAWSAGELAASMSLIWPGKDWLHQHFYTGKKNAKLLFLFQKHLTPVLLKIKRYIQFWTKCSTSAAEIMEQKKFILAKNSSGVRKCFIMTCWPILCIACITQPAKMCEMVVTILKPGDRGRGRARYCPWADPLWLQQGRMQRLKAVKHLGHVCHINFYGGIPPAAEYVTPKSSNAFHSTCAYTAVASSRLMGSISPSPQALIWMKASTPNTMQEKAPAAL